MVLEEKRCNMKILALEVGMIGTNCYIAYNENTNEAVVVDPGDEGTQIMAVVNKHHLKVVAIFVTHGHGDHIMALEDVREATGAPVYISQEDAKLLHNSTGNLSTFLGKARSFGEPDEFFTDGEELTVAGMPFKIYATPGHTRGGVCIQSGDVVFCGDTVFAESIGRTDLPGGDYDTILQSIKDKILTLPDETKLLPGHGPSTTVGWERRRNPFLQ